jgi:hypothetical protein
LPANFYQNEAKLTDDGKAKKKKLQLKERQRCVSYTLVQLCALGETGQFHTAYMLLYM